jgi:hypothetical protein
MILAAAWTLKGGRGGQASMEVFVPRECEGRVTPSAGEPGSF